MAVDWGYVHEDTWLKEEVDNAVVQDMVAADIVGQLVNASHAEESVHIGDIAYTPVVDAVALENHVLGLELAEDILHVKVHAEGCGLVEA